MAVSISGPSEVEEALDLDLTDLFKTIYLDLEPDPGAERLCRLFRAGLQPALDYALSPHLSLLYKGLPPRLGPPWSGDSTSWAGASGSGRWPRSDPGPEATTGSISRSGTSGFAESSAVRRPFTADPAVGMQFEGPFLRPRFAISWPCP
jgi:hypothetical protein